MSFDLEGLGIPDVPQGHGARTKITQRKSEMIPPKSRDTGPIPKQARSDVYLAEPGDSLSNIAKSITHRDMVEFLKHRDFTYAPYTLECVRVAPVDSDPPFGEGPNTFGHGKGGPFVSAEEFLLGRVGDSIYVKTPDGDVYLAPSALRSNEKIPVGFVIDVLEWKKRQV